MQRRRKLHIETTDFWQWAVSHSVRDATVVYRAHVTRRAGNLCFGPRVHARLIPCVAHLATALGIGQTPILIRRGRGGLERTFDRVSQNTSNGRSIPVVVGNLARTYRLKDTEFERRGEIRRVIPFTIVYHSRLRWADYTPVGTESEPVYMPAIVAVLAHELLHAKYPERAEEEIKTRTLPFLREHLDAELCEMRSLRGNQSHDVSGKID